MKNKIKRQLSLWLSVLFVSLFFISCLKEKQPNNNNEKNGAFVLLSINTPQPQLPSSLKGTPITSEFQIQHLQVFVLEELEGEYFFVYHALGSQIQGNSDSQQFKIQLLTTNNPLKLLLLANPPSTFLNTDLIEQGTSEEAVRMLLTQAFDENGLTGNLPMYAESTLPNGVDASEIYSISAKMLRSIAKIEVIKDIEGSHEFILEELMAYRVNNKIQLTPNEPINASAPKVSTPSIPEDTEPLVNPVVKYSIAGSDSIMLYLPESKSAETPNDKLYHATTLVIGGRYGGAENPITYYRCDFNSNIEGHSFGQILRNHYYKFKIKKVSAPGWSNPIDAINSLPISITIEAEAWEDFSTEIYLDEDRFGISAREISLPYSINRFGKLDIQSSLLYQIQWLDGSGNPVGESTNIFGDTISNIHFDAVITPDIGSNPEVSHLVFRTRDYNALSAIITSKLRISTPKWNIDVTVSQESYNLESDRFYSIMSSLGTGDLGTIVELDGTYGYGRGQAMRRLLDKQFCNTGIIKINGLLYTRVANDTYFVGATPTSGSGQANRVEIMRRLLAAHDIVYFTEDARTSQYVTNLLIEWLEASPHRVLIVGTDTDNTNKTLRTALADKGECTWSFVTSPTIANNIMGNYFNRAASGNGTDIFFNGPFGNVPENAIFKYQRGDYRTGYSTDYSTDVIPLITSSKSGMENYMVMGVNKKKRIVYLGDASLFVYTAPTTTYPGASLSNNTGDINTNLDVLMGNVWAWIIEQVTYGYEEE